MKNKNMAADVLAKKAEAMVQDAIDYQGQMSPDRVKAMVYFDGDMTKEMPPRKGWSKANSRDLRAVMAKAMPSILRTILGSDKVVEYQAMSENDEESSAQATDYVNQYVLAEIGAADAIYDACHDALLLRNGVLHWYVDERIRVEGSEHRDLNEMALGELLSGDDVEVLEQSTRQEIQEVDQGEGMPPVQQMVELYTVKIKRVIRDKRIRLVSVPLDEFLINSDALSVDDANLVGQCRKVSRSDLIAMGYDKDQVDRIPTSDANLYSDEERYSRRRYKGNSNEKSKADSENEEIDYYDLHVRLDYDGDGISELRHICFAGGFDTRNILVNEYASEAPYADLTAERRPHQWEGVSLADDVIEIQQIKTALLRFGMDNVYWQNMRQPIYHQDEVENPEALLRPEFGRPIIIKDSGTAKEAIAYNEVPFIAQPILEMIQYWDGQVSERTGIDDSSAGLPPDALQNVTAKASALLEQKGIARVEMLTRSIANGGLKRAFKAILKLVIENQDKARTVRLRDRWVEVDPRSWNAEMDATVNTGLGAGTRERDMMVMQGIMGIQEKMIAGFGPDNPFVKPDNLWAAISGMVEASGLRTPSKYFTKPDPQEIEQIKQSKANEKPIELQVIEAKAMADKALKEAEMPLEIKKLELQTQAAAEKERAQGQAAVDEAIALAEIEAKAKADELALKKYDIDTKAAIEREKMAADVSKHKAQSFGKEVMSMNETAQKPAKDAGPMLLEVLERISNPPKPKGRKIKIVRDDNGDMIGAEEIEDGPEARLN